MKKIILLLLIIGSSSYAQDIEYIKSLNTMDSITASKFAKKIIHNTGEAYEFSRTYLNPAKNVCNYVYRPKGFKGFCDDNCITISFAFNPEGNYYFSSANAKLEYLLPTWKELFIPHATLQSIVEDYKHFRFRDKTSGLNYMVHTNDYQSEIKNYTGQLNN
ncbi:hypothetical protein [Aquimarina algiphila]|uniref:hypothetical protein n=1 Tax=Aquimarina algiphila TaxID=2047982 RepID=UPI00232BD1D5|nr:hypothetical protein [Aquimarina algiphila]